MRRPGTRSKTCESFPTVLTAPIVSGTMPNKIPAVNLW